MYGEPVTTSARLLRSVVSTLLAAAAVVAGTTLVKRARRSRSPELFTDGPLPPVAPPRERHGDPHDRGTAPVYGLDLERLRGAGGLEPVVQYLTYIQSQRGDGSHLLFVRYDDLDAMASLDGAPTPAFLDRLDQLGVVVSNN